MISKKKCTSIYKDELSKLAAVIVTMNPDFKILSQLINSIPNTAKIIIVDNNSQKKSRPNQLNLENKREIKFIINDENKGLATAINQGCYQAKLNGSETVLLLDQDSEPEKNSINLLLKTYFYLLESDVKLGCVGPKLVDVTTGLELGFHRIDGVFWKRLYSDNTSLPIEVSSLNGSGTLMSLDFFLELGGLNDDFFIDHVDTEWSFRVLNLGYALYGIPDAVFLHRMGDKSLRFWLFGWKVWPWRSPLRHRYLFRNAVVLLKKSYVPNVWKFWALVKLLLTFFVHLVVDPQRKEQVKNMISGINEARKVS